MAVQDMVVLEDPDSAALVLDPVRRSILVALREPASAASLASVLDMTRQRVSYYLRTLQDHGLVRQVGERQWGGITERVFEASAASFVVSSEALGALGASPRQVADRLSARYLVALGAQAVRDVGVLARRAAEERRPLATLALDTTIRFASAADRARFSEQLAAAVRSLAASHHSPRSPDGRDHRVVVMAYPVPEEAVA